MDVRLASNLGRDELAALAPVQLILLLLLSLGFGTLFAVNAFVAQSRGAGNPLRCGSYAWNGCWLALFYGFLASLMWFAAPMLFTFAAHEPEVTQLEIQYFRVAVLSLVPQLIAFALTSFFFGIERPAAPMITSGCALLAHAAVGLALTSGWKDLPDFGIDGIGWALLASSSFHAILLTLWVLFSPNLRGFGTTKIRLRFDRFTAIGKEGIPIGLRDLLDNLVWSVALIWLIGKLGTLHLAAASVLLACLDILALPCDGTGAALVALVARSAGRRHFGSARSWLRTGWRMMSAYGIAVGLAFYEFRKPILDLLTDDPEVLNLSYQLSFFIPIILLLYCWNSAFDHALCGAGDNNWATLVNVISTAITLVGGGIAFLSYFFSTASFGVWTLVALNLIFTVSALWLRWVSGHWTKRTLVAPQ